MQIDAKLAQDRLSKIFYISMAIAPIAFMYFILKELVGYQSSISPELKSYSGLVYATTPITLMISFSFIIMFSDKIKRSVFNNTKLERVICDFLNKIELIKSSVWIYRILLASFYGFFYYTYISSIILMANDVKLFQEFNLVTMKTNDYFQVISNYFVTCLIISTLLTISLLLIKPKKGISDFLTGLIFIPLLLNGVIYGIVGNPFALIFKDLHNEMLFISSPVSFIGNFGLIVFYIASALLISFIVYYALKDRNKLMQYILGYASSIAAIAISLFLVLAGKPVHYFNNNPNIMDVEVLGQTYRIDQTLLSEMDDMDTEFLIESYVGLSMHNSTDALGYLLSDKYIGNKEQAIKLVADITLKNFILYEDKKEKVVESLKTKKISMSSSVNILIPFIINEASPLNHQKRTLESILKGDYQLAVDYYIEDAINRQDIETYSLKMKDKDKQTRIGSFGHPMTQNLISTLLHLNFADLDYNKVNSDKREKLKELLKPVTIYKDFTDEQVKEWFKIFKAERFL
ncbi:hypothetical protein [Vibrio parahaemolyticus]|uniref:hypothetical protein n=1 Tax=Vibrio parahaemolyticus TaxID=670 RepID=UPI00226A8320|nr:hypothetical protein [Vibrio parahaemolyticus]MCX8795810.1 hypothetical protein [Vibrio parahaemolyticus]